MAVESQERPLGLSRLDAVQEGIASGQSVEPIEVSEIVRAYVPTNPTNRERKGLKLTWPGLKELAQQELNR